MLEDKINAADCLFVCFALDFNMVQLCLITNSIFIYHLKILLNHILKEFGTTNSSFPKCYIKYSLS